MGKLNKMPKRMQSVTVKLVQQASDSWREGKTAHQRGYGHKWRVYRAGYLHSHRYCRYCLQALGMTGMESNCEVEMKLDALALLACMATVVDHIMPHRGDMNLFWQHSNHQPLCKHCHDSVKQKQEKQ